MPKPIRWFSLPQLFRYERQQRGRLREHFQLNVDIVGADGVAADAEVLAVAIDALRELGLTETDFAARVNDRRLVTAILMSLGVSEEGVNPTLAVIDKAGRRDADKVRALLIDAGVPERSVPELMDLVAEPGWDSLVARFDGDAKVRTTMEPLVEHRRVLEAMGLGTFVEFDFSIVRGLAYYTGIVFELFDRAGQLRAICGGGRYDRLLERVGGEPLSAVGFGMGDVVLSDLLQGRGLTPDTDPSCDLFVIWVEEAQRALAMNWAHRWRDEGARVLYTLKEQGVAKQLKVAARAGARNAVIIGSDEASEESATVRDMETGAERRLPLSQVFPGGEA